MEDARGRVLEGGDEDIPTSLWPHLLGKSIQVFEKRVFLDLPKTFQQRTCTDFYPRNLQDSNDEICLVKPPIDQVTEEDALYTLLRLGAIDISNGRMET